jgi:hypothetical protein
VLDAAGVTLGDRQEWRAALIAAGVDSDLVDRVQADVRSLLSDRAAAAPTVHHRHEPIDLLLEHIQVLGEPTEWAPWTTYQSLALVTIDSLWSSGVRYTGVRNVIARYRAARARAGADADRDTPKELARFIEDAGGAEGFAEVVANRQRTSSQGGILKAEAVALAADVLIDAGMSVPADIAAATPEELAKMRDRWTAIRGQGSGLSWDYFLMLTGQQGVKADRMIRRFVADALGRDGRGISESDARTLVTEAAGRLGIGLSRLDYAIWLHQSGNRPT